MEKESKFNARDFITTLFAFIYFFIGVVVKVVLDTEFDISFFYFILSSIPVIIFFVIYYLYRFNEIKHEKIKVNKKIKDLRIGTSILCICSCAMSYNYIFLFNACLSAENEINVSGVVSEMNIIHSKNAEYDISLKETNLNRQLKLQIPKEEYKSLVVGSVYSRKWRVGVFGILYWKKWEKA